MNLAGKCTQEAGIMLAQSLVRRRPVSRFPRHLFPAACSSPAGLQPPVCTLGPRSRAPPSALPVCRRRLPRVGGLVILVRLGRAPAPRPSRRPSCPGGSERASLLGAGPASLSCAAAAPPGARLPCPCRPPELLMLGAFPVPPSGLQPQGLCRAQTLLPLLRLLRIFTCRRLLRAFSIYNNLSVCFPQDTTRGSSFVYANFSGFSNVPRHSSCFRTVR
ncbi:PREDICTED: uncharacterized protein LOC102023290 [Chinchilla lanigera]|uniref:uncharacterized protein LOC102023290 n=1 Tax=Chinchilla lanigera TaxID=34839 RepID=UPI0006989D5D|nr:PREDICTED: uncharacterized protein LOC102023290 [Chinchilla lanigera]XP_013371745.1 PREDICTED: uncharacterized protein LOC102023290 [Chinchilla lanigera]